MQKVARNVGVLIEKEMGNFVGVMWDGWSHSSVHYMAIYGVFIVKGKQIVQVIQTGTCRPQIPPPKKKTGLFRNAKTPCAFSL
ncbi:hypothetical protein JG688_00018525 [Phytophthora aleatoria]|uniref:Uncharacterized protein n=1 Tax=Phytophthora aleatoria TaxID=2496075 RepID=A0A8J5IBV0_9STRA|nr:hypothetical protein JG688_00018525 [Phytophthora aleatoria]